MADNDDKNVEADAVNAADAVDAGAAGMEELDVPEVGMEAPAGGPPGGAPVAQAPSKAYPQLYKFMWGGIIVVLGSLLPFGSTVVSTMYGDLEEIVEAAEPGKSRAEILKEMADKLGTGEVADEVAEQLSASNEEPKLVLPARGGYETFTGALFLLFGLMLVGQMRTSISERRVKLGAVLLMLFPCGWTWYKFIVATGEISGFSWGSLYKLTAWERLATDVGSGFLLVLIGSTYVVLQFVKALAGAAGGGKPAPTPAGAGAGRGGRGNRRR